jgi:hypothetical protein
VSSLLFIVRNKKLRYLLTRFFIVTMDSNDNSWSPSDGREDGPPAMGSGQAVPYDW